MPITVQRDIPWQSHNRWVAGNLRRPVMSTISWEGRIGKSEKPLSEDIRQKHHWFHFFLEFINDLTLDSWVNLKGSKYSHPTKAVCFLVVNFLIVKYSPWQPTYFTHPSTRVQLGGRPFCHFPSATLCFCSYFGPSFDSLFLCWVTFWLWFHQKNLIILRTKAQQFRCSNVTVLLIAISPSIALHCIVHYFHTVSVVDNAEAKTKQAGLDIYCCAQLFKSDSSSDWLGWSPQTEPYSCSDATHGSIEHSIRRCNRILSCLHPQPSGRHLEPQQGSSSYSKALSTQLQLKCSSMLFHQKAFQVFRCSSDFRFYLVLCLQKVL